LHLRDQRHAWHTVVDAGLRRHDDVSVSVRQSFGRLV
jgi:hypothetical protein